MYFFQEKPQELGLGKLPGPKFIRLQELHKFLFYLTRDYQGQSDMDQELAWQTIKDHNPMVDTTDLLLPRVYHAELSWRWVSNIEVIAYILSKKKKKC